MPVRCAMCDVDICVFVYVVAHILSLLLHYTLFPFRQINYLKKLLVSFVLLSLLLSSLLLFSYDAFGRGTLPTAMNPNDVVQCSDFDHIQ